ncbi:hypothetical protein KJ765_01775 [Candidatus Micrarchaeota archaeon]|nr:hypothetical protein [Candidatus Micrarchaeota archaeon]
MADLSGWSIAYYAYFALGSVALGYLLLRLTYPEVRLFDLNLKMGVSAISGFLIAIAAFIVDYVYNSADVVTRQGLFPLVFFLLIIGAFGVLKLYFLIFQSNFLTVGIPMASSSIAFVPQHRESEPAHHESKPASDSHESHKPELRYRKERETKPVHASSPVAPLHPAAPAIAKPVQRKEPEPSPETPLDLDLTRVMRTDSFKPVQPQKPSEKEKELQRMSPAERLKRVQKESVSESKPPEQVPPASPAPSHPAERAKPVPEKIVPNHALLPPARTQDVLPPREQKPLDKEAKRRQIILKLKQEESYIEPKKGGMLTGLFSMLQTKSKPKKLVEKPLTILKAPSKEPLRLHGMGPLPRKELSAAPKTPHPQESGGHLATITRVVEEERAKKQKTRVEPIQTSYKEIMEPSVIPLKPEGGKSSKTERTRTGQLREITADDSQESPNAQENPEPHSSDDIIMTVHGPRRMYSERHEPAPPTEEDEMADALVSGAPEKTAPKMVRRRYMSSQGTDSDDVSVIANRETARSENFDSIVSDVYSQLKDSERKGGLRNKLSVNAPSKEKAAATEPAAKLSFEDLLPEKKEEKAREKQSEVFQQLRGMADKKESDIAFVKMEANKSMGCPTCHAQNSRIIFCPYCGKGLCANCSPKIKPHPDHFVYACPNCKEDIEVKKKVNVSA